MPSFLLSTADAPSGWRAKKETEMKLGLWPKKASVSARFYDPDVAVNRAAVREDQQLERDLVNENRRLHERQVNSRVRDAQASRNAQGD